MLRKIIVVMAGLLALLFTLACEVEAGNHS